MKNELFISMLPLKTKRLIIRRTSTDDVDMILKMDKQEVTQTFLGGIKNKTREERIAFLDKKVKKFKEGQVGSLTVCLKNGTPIGFLGFDIDEQNNNAEISYIFDSDYCKHGYCTEACQKVISVSFDKIKLNKIYADTIEGNIGSERVLEKLGFNHEGTRRKVVYVNTVDDYRDFLDYGLLKSEYEEVGRKR